MQKMLEHNRGKKPRMVNSLVIRCTIREKTLVVLLEVLKKGYMKSHEFKVVPRNGINKNIDMSLGIMKDTDGKPIGFVVTIREAPEQQKTR
jgi:hypothetical protein